MRSSPGLELQRTACMNLQAEQGDHAPHLVTLALASTLTLVSYTLHHDEVSSKHLSYLSTDLQDHLSDYSDDAPAANHFELAVSLCIM